MRDFLFPYTAIALRFLFLTLLSINGNGQGDFHVAYFLTQEQGLPGRNVWAMTEDTFGFTWMGGAEGIAKYDGITFIHYKSKEGNPLSLIDNRIICLLADGNRLWIGTRNGLSMLNLLTEKFTNYQFDSTGIRNVTDQMISQEINALHKDQQGNIWIGTAHWGPIKYESHSGKFETFPIPPADIPAYVIQPKRLETVLDFCNDVRDPNTIWIGLFAGLMKMDVQSGRYQLYTFPFANKEEQISRNAFRTIHQHKDGKIYAGAWFNVLQVFDPVTGLLESLPQEYIIEENMQAMAVRNICPASDSTLWITSNMGVLRYHPQQNKILFAWINDEKEGTVYAVDFIDSRHRIYSFRDQGLTFFDPSQQQYIPVSFSELNPEGVGLGFYAAYDHLRHRYMICVGNTLGLYHFSLRTIGWHITPIPDQKPPTGTSFLLRNIEHLDQDQYILAAGHTIYMYDAGADKISPVPVSLPMEVPRIHNVYVDSKKNAWIATVHDGVLQWNTTTNSIRKHTFPDDPEFGAGNEDTFIEDHGGRIWIKCRNAFVVYDPAKDTMSYYAPADLITPFYTTFAEDSRGQMWLASTSGWIGRVDLSLPELIAERHDLGRREEGLSTFQIDSSDQLWCAFPNKLVQFDTKSKTKTTFAYSPDLRASGFFYMKYMPDGRLVFTAKDEIFIMDTDKLETGQRQLFPYLTNIDIREQPLQTDTVVHRLKVLRLRPNENFFSLSFSAFGLMHGEDFKFRYRLIGFQDDWITVTDRKIANFTNVPSGQYTFELQVAVLTGEFSESIYTLPIIIEKRFLQKTWVRLAGIFLLIAFIHSIYLYRIHQIRKEEALKTEFQQQLAMAETNALRAQMNPHFIFNSLNSIENYILKNNPDKAAAYLNDFARLIRLILQNSRAKQIPLITELETLELYLEMEQLRFGEKFEYKVHVDDHIHTQQIEIPPLLIQPYVENAIWHGLMPKAGSGRVTISISQVNHMLHITIEDNGIGREKSAEIQSKRKQNQTESIGMAITRDRIELMNKIHETEANVIITDLKDEAGQASGTRVDITIPV